MSCNTCARQAVATLSTVGVSERQTMAVYGSRSIGQTWQYLPRCPTCKKWVSPRHGRCGWVKCKSHGEQVVEPTGWPPTGARILRDKGSVRAAQREERLQGYHRLEGAAALGNLEAGQMAQTFDEALAQAPAAPDPETVQGWQRDAQRFLDYAAEQGVHLPISGRRMTAAEAYAYQQLGEQITYPDQALSEAVDIAEAAFAGEGSLEEADDLPPPPKNRDDYRISAADPLGAGGPKTKYRANVAAIRLLKELEAEDRPATEEEKEVLVQYVGWGGLAQVFDERQGHSWYGGDWQDEYQELKELLSEAEYESARATTPNAHYTSPDVIRGIYAGLQRLGFRGGRVLEPAAGVGHFLGLMPEEMTERSDRSAVEIDDLSGRILRQLYPEADVHQTGFEKAGLPDNYYDVVIGNFPFGNYPVYDPDYDTSGKRHLTGSIHNYFAAKSLDSVKPGGIVAFVTSRYTMDSQDPAVREYLAAQGKFLGAVRLPNTAFKDSARTEVTTDVIFLQKRQPGEIGDEGDNAWLDAGQTEVPDADGNLTPATLNQYFINHPAQMLGDLKATGSMYRRGELTLAGDGRDLGAALQTALKQLPSDIVQPATLTRCPDCGAFSNSDGCRNCERLAQLTPAPVAGQTLKEGGYTVEQGQVYRQEAGKLVAVTTKGDAAERIAGMLAIRDQARQVLQLNLTASDADLAQAQQKLGTIYDAFVAQYGSLSDKKNGRVLKHDPDYPFLLALERRDPETGQVEKEAIFTRRTVQVYRAPERVERADEALAVTLNELGYPDWGRMSALTGQSPAALQRELVAQGRVFEDPQQGWVLREEYLSGNIHHKLQAAEIAAKGDPRFQANLAALKTVLPPDIEPGDIYAPLGSSWIEASDVQDFINRELGLGAAYAPVEVRYLETSAEWVVDKGRHFRKYSVENTTTWGTRHTDALTLVTQALNGKTPTLYHPAEEGERRVVDQEATLAARQKQQQINDRFEAWLWEDEARAERLARKYNDRFNREVPRRYDGSHLTIPGMNADISLRSHQKDAAWRIAHAPDNVLLAHRVGAGKTFTMIAGGMERRRLFGDKVLHVVPNHMLDQYSQDVRTLFPNAKVLAVAAKDLGKTKRNETMSRIATGDYDAIVVTHDAVNRVPLRPETVQSYIREQLRDYDAHLREVQGNRSGVDRRTVKRIEAAKKRLAVKLERLTNRPTKDDAIYFEDLGLNTMLVDEAHTFKNLETPTKLNRVAGIAQGGSERAFDMYMKVRYLSQRCRCGQFIGQSGVCANCRAATEPVKGKVVFATGTPVANTLGEMHVMQRFLMHDQLKAKGLLHFDAWAKTFGNTRTALEMKPDGSGFREFTRFAEFKNVPELMRMMRQVADIHIDAEKLGLKLPDLKGGQPEGVSAPTSPWLKEFIQQCARRAENLPNVQPDEDNMLKIVGDARKAALDPRLIDPGLPDDPHGKVNQAVKHIGDIYQRSSAVELPGQTGPQRMAQMVFLDLSTPNKGSQHQTYQAQKAGHIAEGLSVPQAQQQAAADALAQTAGCEDFNVYDDLKLKLIALGIPEEEIAFIHDATTDAKKLALFERVNRGQVRVLLGSTTKMGTGTNAQQRLIALHHLDAPWRPADIEQRDGRILRQGNLNPAVEIKRYVTEGSFDTYMWQTLENKARFIAQVMSDPDNPLRNIEDLDAVTFDYADLKALATGNPIMIDKIKADNQLRQLKTLRRAHHNRLSDIKVEVRATEQGLARNGQRLARWQTHQQSAPPPLETFALTLNGRTYRGKKAKAEAGEAVAQLAAELVNQPPKRVQVGQMNGYPLFLRAGGSQRPVELLVEFMPGQTAQLTVGQQATRTMTRLQAMVNDYPAQEIERLQNRIAEREGELLKLRAELDKPFTQETEYQETLNQVIALQQEIEAMNQAQHETAEESGGMGERENG